MGFGEYKERAKRHAINLSSGARNETVVVTRNAVIDRISAPPRFFNKNSQSLISQPTRSADSEICDSIRHFNRYGIGLPTLRYATRAAAITGRLAGEELIRSGGIGKAGFAYICADHFGLDFVPEGPDFTSITGYSRKFAAKNVADKDGIYSTDFANIVTEYRGWNAKPNIYVAGEPHSQKPILKLLEQPNIHTSQVKITTQKALHFSQFLAQANQNLDRAINGLAQVLPAFSAQRVVTPRQISVLFALLFSLVAIYAINGTTMIVILHLMASSFYLAITLMRAMMIIPGSRLANEPPSALELSAHNSSDLPVYTVMVALYKEANQIADLTRSLNNLNWPHDRLQVLLICEEDDPETIAKCEEHGKNEIFQTIVCPTAHPKTKPKALNYSLPLAKGEFLVLYDAEDRPHPLQLKETYAKFRSTREFGCLQAPLVIHNDKQSWLSRMFAIEYVTQFSFILPVLERWNSPIPLGGTSNHFVTSVLKKIGGWDPYNVTEDADLGMRLARGGHRCGTIKYPTFEEAPPVFSQWYTQRTRWIKGWLQTLLVHMRHPAQLTRDLGTMKTIFFHLVVSSIVISVLIHPFFIASGIYYTVLLSQNPQLTLMEFSMLGIDAFNLVGGYTAYFIIAWLALSAAGKRHLQKYIFLLPVYWLLISLAGWRAVYQLFTCPHKWEKTVHGLWQE